MSLLEYQIARRFRGSKKRSGFTSFIASSSTIGIALGCFVLIVLLSVMNGFERELKDRLLSAIPHGELRAVDASGLQNWQQITNAFSEDTRVRLTQPFIKATALLQRGKRNKAIEVQALDSNLAQHSTMFMSLSPEQMQTFKETENGVLLGSRVLDQMKLSIGDKVQILLPQQTDDLRLTAPKSAWLQVVGEITLGGDLDSFIGVMHLDKASTILNVAEGAQGVQLFYNDPFSARAITRELGYRLPQHVYMSDWTRTQGHLYQDIQLVRTVVYIALTLVIAVASFNIVSSLVMAVNEKQSEIAMLKTMGAKPSMIAKVFVFQGAINGIIGTVFGTILGVITAINLSSIAQGLEELLGIKLLSGEIYFIDFLPSELNWNEVFITVAIALMLSVLATLYPAIKASHVEPAKVLGH